MSGELYPSLKPLPQPPPEQVKEHIQKGQVRASVYERRMGRAAFKKR